jgi:hypothetical protein
MRVSFLLLLATACFVRTNTSDLDRCEASDPTVDCCRTDAQCRTRFGSSFPYCETPGELTGRCVECRVLEDCDLDAFCLADPEHGSWCAPLSAANP